jgi:hypothetical protein
VLPPCEHTEKHRRPLSRRSSTVWRFAGPTSPARCPPCDTRALLRRRPECRTYDPNVRLPDLSAVSRPPVLAPSRPVSRSPCETLRRYGARTAHRIGRAIAVVPAARASSVMCVVVPSEAPSMLAEFAIRRIGSTRHAGDAVVTAQDAARSGAPSAPPNLHFSSPPYWLVPKSGYYPQSRPA